MKVQKIKYHNYRCFRDVEVEFDKSEDKNITMIVAPNGGGKTEMLFSFWWVLYDFKFSGLRGKEDTAYSLNSTKYFELQNSEPNTIESCSVELWFEKDGNDYRIKRTEKFLKVKGKRNPSIEQELEFVEANPQKGIGVTIRDKDIIRSMVEKIIPQKILYGIIFDGERMQQLSSQDETSTKTVQGIITQITNEILLNKCLVSLESLSKKNSREIGKVGRQHGFDTIEALEKDIQRLKQEIKKHQITIEVCNDELVKIANELEKIHRQLEFHNESKVLEGQRDTLRSTLKRAELDLDKYIDVFYKELDHGYLLISSPLFEDVKNLLDKYDVPAGLTTHAVRSILKRDKCICGHPLSEQERRTLESLLDTLPPDNINSTIMEMVRDTEEAQKEHRDLLIRYHKDVVDCEGYIASIKNNIAEISVRITEGASEEVKKLEKRNQELLQAKITKEMQISDAKEKISNAEAEMKQKMKDRDNAISSNEAVSFFLKKERVYDKYTDAIKAVQEYNKLMSLQRINSLINEAYKHLSEDYERGRRLHIMQYSNGYTLQYRIVSYYLSNYEEKESQFVRDKTMDLFRRENLTDDQIRERIIDQVKESSSTGQSKINTLAFAKAILDYSSEKRDEESIEIAHDYPFMIDSPFTELSDGNLLMSAQSLHKFSKQIILMISSESLEGIDKYIMPYVGKGYTLVKNEKESYSSINVL